MNASLFYLVGLLGASVVAAAAAGTESGVLMEEVTTTEVRTLLDGPARPAENESR